MNYSYDEILDTLYQSYDDILEETKKYDGFKDEYTSKIDLMERMYPQTETLYIMLCDHRNKLELVKQMLESLESQRKQYEILIKNTKDNLIKLSEMLTLTV